MKTLIQYKEEIAKKYGYASWLDVNFYPESENAKTPEPPYFKERLHDEAAELYASQFKAEIAASRDLNHELILKLAAAAPQFKSKDNIPGPDSQIYTLNDMFEFAKMCGNVSGDGYYKMQFKEWIKTRKPIFPDIGK